MLGGTHVPGWGEAAPHTLVQHQGWCGLGQLPLGHAAGMGHGQQ